MKPVSMPGLAKPKAFASTCANRRAVTARRPVPPVRAMGIDSLVIGAVEAASKPGDVDAPIGLIIGGAILVTIVLTAGIPAALSPGNKAAEKIFERDARSGRKR
ncbi:g10917 [Coccomyxa elongata]